MAPLINCDGVARCSKMLPRWQVVCRSGAAIRRSAGPPASQLPALAEAVPAATCKLRGQASTMSNAILGSRFRLWCIGCVVTYAYIIYQNTHKMPSSTPVFNFVVQVVSIVSPCLGFMLLIAIFFPVEEVLSKARRHRLLLLDLYFMAFSAYVMVFKYFETRENPPTERILRRIVASIPTGIHAVIVNYLLYTDGYGLIEVMRSLTLFFIATRLVAVVIIGSQEDPPAFYPPGYSSYHAALFSNAVVLLGIVLSDTDGRQRVWRMMGISSVTLSLASLSNQQQPSKARDGGRDGGREETTDKWLAGPPDAHTDVASEYTDVASEFKSNMSEADVKSVDRSEASGTIASMLSVHTTGLYSYERPVNLASVALPDLPCHELDGAPTSLHAALERIALGKSIEVPTGDAILVLGSLSCPLWRRVLVRGALEMSQELGGLPVLCVYTQEVSAATLRGSELEPRARANLMIGSHGSVGLSETAVHQSDAQHIALRGRVRTRTGIPSRCQKRGVA